MVYGSLSGGLWVLELDKTTGKPIYPGKDGTDSISNNYVDRYWFLSYSLQETIIIILK